GNSICLPLLSVLPCLFFLAKAQCQPHNKSTGTLAGPQHAPITSVINVSSGARGRNYLSSYEGLSSYLQEKSIDAWAIWRDILWINCSPNLTLELRSQWVPPHWYQD
ncbi:hypothetical protein SERLADRAFT_476704, partial [Serpula lacrymans var. lacrymans S7.9]